MAPQSLTIHTYDANNIYLVNLENYLQGHDDINKVRMSQFQVLFFQEMIRYNLMILFDFLRINAIEEITQNIEL